MASFARRSARATGRVNWYIRRPHFGRTDHYWGLGRGEDGADFARTLSQTPIYLLDRCDAFFVPSNGKFIFECVLDQKIEVSI